MREPVGDLDVAPRMRDFLSAVELMQRDPTVPVSVRAAFHALAMLMNDPYAVPTLTVSFDEQDGIPGP